MIVFSSTVGTEYAETAAGRTTTFTAQTVRYVRDDLNGNTVNNGNHWVEIEGWGANAIAYVGNYYEWTGPEAASRRHYYAGRQHGVLPAGGPSRLHQHHGQQQRRLGGRGALPAVGRDALPDGHHPDDVPLHRAAAAAW